MNRTIYLTDVGRTAPPTVIPTGMPSRLTVTRTDRLTAAGQPEVIATTAMATTAIATTPSTPDRVARSTWRTAAPQSTARRTLSRMAEGRVSPPMPDRGRLATAGRTWSVAAGRAWSAAASISPDIGARNPAA